MIYSIQATVTTKPKGTRQVPTFYLDSAVQFILNKEHAGVIAKDIVNPTRDEAIEVEVTVYETTKKWN